MTKRNEISIYNQSQVQSDGEIPEWDDVIFPQIIRKKIIEKVTFIIEYQKPNLTLDYGCGGGWISNLISNKGFDVVGFDISHGIISKARESTKGNFLVCDAEYLPFKQRSFDLIIGISVLHHLNNLQKGIYEIYMILRDKGHLFFEEPNLLNPFSAFGRRFFLWKHILKMKNP